MVPSPSLSLLLTTGLGLGLATGCAPAQTPRPVPAWALVTEDGRRPSVRAPRPRDGIRGHSEASDLVVAALQESGLRFGTDGRVRSLWGYLRESHKRVAPDAVQPGDVVFFRTRAPGNADCDDPDHAGLVAAVETDGRIDFVEARGGLIRRSYVDPQRPRDRRDESGRVLNSFLRPKKVGDPDDTPTFAGEMLCAVVRPRAPARR
jgi:hypothetical protein